MCPTRPPSPASPIPAIQKKRTEASRPVLYNTSITHFSVPFYAILLEGFYLPGGTTGTTGTHFSIKPPIYPISPYIYPYIALSGLFYYFIVPVVPVVPVDREKPVIPRVYRVLRGGTRPRKSGTTGTKSQFVHILLERKSGTRGAPCTLSCSTSFQLFVALQEGFRARQ